MQCCCKIRYLRLALVVASAWHRRLRAETRFTSFELGRVYIAFKTVDAHLSLVMIPSVIHGGAPYFGMLRSELGFCRLRREKTVLGFLASAQKRTEALPRPFLLGKPILRTVYVQSTLQSTLKHSVNSTVYIKL